MNTSRPYSHRALAVLLFAAGFMTLSGLVMLLWNELMPALLNVPPVNYWQAMGLFTLSRLLFGGIRLGGWHTYGKHTQAASPEAKGRFNERWKTLSEQERQQFKEEWARRCAPKKTEQ